MHESVLLVINDYNSKFDVNKWQMNGDFLNCTTVSIIKVTSNFFKVNVNVNAPLYFSVNICLDTASMTFYFDG